MSDERIHAKVKHPDRWCQKPYTPIWNEGKTFLIDPEPIPGTFCSDGGRMYMVFNGDGSLVCEHVVEVPSAETANWLHVSTPSWFLIALWVVLTFSSIVCIHQAHTIAVQQHTIQLMEKGCR